MGKANNFIIFFNGASLNINGKKAFYFNNGEGRNFKMKIFNYLFMLFFVSTVAQSMTLEVDLQSDDDDSETIERVEVYVFSDEVPNFLFENQNVPLSGSLDIPLRALSVQYPDLDLELNVVMRDGVEWIVEVEDDPIQDPMKGEGKVYRLYKEPFTNGDGWAPHLKLIE
jgi:hypothetical protein